jgi:hypothetical protein
MTATLRDAERYVGMEYVEGEFDCASLAVLVQKELFGRTIDLPQAGQRARGRRGQAKDILTYQPKLATPVEAPSTGDAVVMWGGAEPARRWHVGTAFVQNGEVWILHCADEARGVVLQRMSHVLEQGLHLDGCYSWIEQVPQQLAIASHPVTGVVEHRTTAAGRTLAETLKGEGVFGPGWIVSVGGREVPQAMWSRTRVKPGQLIEARAVMRKQILYIVAMIVLTYFTLGAGLAAWAGTGVVATAIGAVAFIGGSMLISKFLGPKAASAGNLSGMQPPPTYALQGGRNRPRPYEPLSLVLGECKALPDVANQPFTWFEGEDQHLSAMFHAGINCASVSDIRLGDAPITNYEEVTLRQYGFPTGNAGTPPVIGTSVDSIEGGALDAPTSPGAWVTRTTSVGTARIEIDIEGTLQDMNSKGNWRNATCSIFMEYRPYRPVSPLLWGELGGGDVVLTHLGPKPLRRTFSFDVSPDQYEVRIRKVTANATSTQSQNTLTWTALKSYQPDEADYGGQPRVELRMKATGQLNGAPDEVNWIAKGASMPYWNGTAWVTATEAGASGISNPGAIILMLLRGLYRSSDGRLIAGAGLSDNRIDIDSLKGFMVRCAAKGYRFDSFIQEAINLGDLLESIAAAGLGTLSRHSGRIGVVWMAEDQPIEGVINMASMKAKSFSVSYDLIATADEYQLEFFDADRSWTWQPIRVIAPGIVTPQRTSTENVRGVTRAAHAATIARFTMGQNIYGRKSISFEMDLEHLVYRRGSVIALSHDLTQWGHSGRITSVATSTGQFVVTVDEPVPLTVTATRTLGLRLSGEQQMRVFNVASISADGRQLTVNQSWPTGVAVPGASTAAHDGLWIYDFKTTPGYRCRVVSIEPGSDMKGAQVTVVPEPPEFWNYVATGEYIAPPNNSLLSNELPVASNLKVTRTRVRAGEGWEHELSASWDVVGNYDHAQVWAAPVGAPLAQIASVFGTQHSWRVAPDQTWSVEIRPFDALGRMGTKAAVVYTDPAVLVGAVVGLTATVEANGIVARWQVPQGLAAVDWSVTQLRDGATWATASVLFEGRTSSHNMGWLSAGTHILWAAHRNTAGDWSTPVSTSVQINPPIQPIVTGNAWRDQVELQWTISQGTQPLRGYEVRVGDIFASATILSVVDALGYIYTPPAPATYMYWVTAIDMGGNRGPSGYKELTTLPGITDALAELQEGLDDVVQQIDNLPTYEDTWGVRVISANGPKVGGLIFGNTGTQTDFVVLSDRFAWALPDGTGVKYPLVLGTINGTPSFGFQGNMFIDGTVKARMVDVDQIYATHIRSEELETRHFKTQTLTAITAEISRSANLLKNTEIVTTKGWSFYDGTGGQCTSGRNLPDATWYPVGGNALSILQVGATQAPAGWYMDIPVEAGKRYEFSAGLASHRCNAYVAIEWYTSAFVNVGGANGVSGIGGGGNSLSAFPRRGGFGTPPAGATIARFLLWKQATIPGNGDSWGWFTQPYFGVANQYQTVLSDYSPSGQGTRIGPEGIETTSLSAISPDLGLIVNGMMRSADGQMVIDMDGKSVTMQRNGRRITINPSGFYFGADNGVGNRLLYDLNSGALTWNGTFTSDAINVVNTLNIARNAVTTISTFTKSLESFGGNQTTWRNLGTAPVFVQPNASGALVAVQATANSGLGSGVTMGFQVRNVTTGTTIAAWDEPPSNASSGGSFVYTPNRVVIDDAPAAGTNTYVLEGRFSFVWAGGSELSILNAQR